jgi:hypothetical protein
MMNKIAATLIFLLMCAFAAQAQVNDVLKNATWVRIMHNDTTVNYFVAKHDFAKFVAQHKKEEAQERNKEKSTANAEERQPNEEHLKSPENAAIMAFQQWSKTIKPFVTADGKIMPVEQRMALVDKRK